MSDRVPIYRSSQRITSQPIVDASTGGGGAMQALSRSMGDLQRTLSGVGQEVAAEAEERRFGEARRDALTAPIRDEAGNYTVPEPDFGTRVGRMSAETILARIVDEETISGRERAVQMRAAGGGDPERFVTNWRADMETRLQAVPTHARERVGQMLRQVGVEHTNAQRMEVVQRDQRNTEAGWRAVLGSTNDDIEGLARAGQFDGPEFRAATARLTAHLDRGVREGFISPETRQVTLSSISERAGSQAIFRGALDRLDGGESADDVTRAFEAEMDRRGIAPAARSGLRGMLRTAVNEHQARQSHMRSELRADLEDWERVASSGLVPFDASVGVRLAERADAAGDASLAARIRRQQQAYVEMSGLRSASLPDLRQRQQELLAEMRAAASQEERAAIYDRIRAVRTMDTARAQQMRDDPFGTAIRIHAGKNGVGDIRPLDFSNTATMADQLTQRASAARLLGTMERVPDMPVITAAEAGVLSGIIRDGDVGTQQGLLSALRRLPLNTLTRTLHALVPGEGRQADARVHAFVVAASLMERSPNASMEILNGMERQRLAPIAALQGPAVDEAIVAHIGAAYRDNATALAAINAAARALYTQRASSGIDAVRTPGRSNLDDPAIRRLDTGLLGRILDEIAPTLKWRGEQVPAPIRNNRPMTEAEFADQMASLPPHVLAGARAANDAPITPAHVRGFGQLVAVREGQYAVLISGFPVRGADGRPFTLDLSRPWPDAPDDFRRHIRQGESGHRAAVVNSEGFAGLYQFGTERLAELTYYSPARGEGRNGWQGTFRIPGFPQVRNLQDFLRSPEAQEAVAEVHFADIDDAIARLGPAAAPFNRNGLRAVAHLGGVEGMRRFVQSGGTFNRADSNGTTLSAYYRRFSDGGVHQEGPNR